MRSKIFREFDPHASPEFERDLKRTLALTAAQAQVVAGESAEFHLARLERTKEALVADLSRKAQLAFADTRSALNVFSFFLRMLTQDKFASDRPEDLFEDLRETELVSSEQRPTFIAGLETVKIVAVSSIEEIDKARSAAGILPSLDFAEATVELRGVTKPSFSPGDKAETYEPRLTGLVPIVSVRIVVDRGQPSEFFFQCDEFQLNLLLDQIRAAEKDFLLLKKEVKAIESAKPDPRSRME